MKGPYGEVGSLFPKLTLERKEKSTHTEKPPFKPIFHDFAASKEMAKIEEEMTVEKYKVYSDGSVMDGGVGAAAVLFENGREKSMIRMYLGTQADAHNAYEAELVGISLALELIRREMAVEDVMLYGDHQGAFSAIRKLCSEDGHGRAREQMILEQLERVSERHGNIRVEIGWIPGHKGIFGMQRADKEAKRSTKRLLMSNKISPPDCGVCSFR